MGWDGDAQQFQELTAEQAKDWKKGPVFRVGEEIEIKGLTFIVADIAPGQIKIKPKRTNDLSNAG